MRLRVLLPTHVEVDEEVSKVIVETVHGSMCFLPRHLDYVSVLGSGLLSYESDAGETFLAVNDGILVKCGADVSLAVAHAVRGPNLGELRPSMEKTFRELAERDQAAKGALLRLEADFLQRAVQLDEPI